MNFQIQTWSTVDHEQWRVTGGVAWCVRERVARSGSDRRRLAQLMVSAMITAVVASRWCSATKESSKDQWWGPVCPTIRVARSGLRGTVSVGDQQGDSTSRFGSQWHSVQRQPTETRTTCNTKKNCFVVVKGSVSVQQRPRDSSREDRIWCTVKITDMDSSRGNWTGTGRAAGLRQVICGRTRLGAPESWTGLAGQVAGTSNWAGLCGLCLKPLQDCCRRLHRYWTAAGKLRM